MFSTQIDTLAGWSSDQMNFGDLNAPVGRTPDHWMYLRTQKTEKVGAWEFLGTASPQQSSDWDPGRMVQQVPITPTSTVTGTTYSIPPPEPPNTGGPPGGSGNQPPTGGDGNEGVDRKLEQPVKLSTLWISLFSSVAVIFVFCAILLIAFPGTNLFGVPLGVAGMIVTLLYLVPVSLNTIPDNKRAGMFLMGMPLYNLEPGPALVPWGITYVILMPMDTFQMELPGELLYYEEGTIPPDKVALGYVQPFRATFIRGTAAHLDPLEVQLTAGIKVILEAEIEDPCRFRRKVGSIKKAKKRLEDLIQAFCTQHLSQMTLRQALRELPKLHSDLREALDTLVVHWGLNISLVKIKEIQLSHALNTAILQASIEEANKLAKIAIAQAEAASRIIKARAERAALAFEGDGRGKAHKNELAGLTEGMQNMVNSVTGVNPNHVFVNRNFATLANSPHKQLIMGGDGLLGSALGKILNDDGGWNGHNHPTRPAASDQTPPNPNTQPPNQTPPQNAAGGQLPNQPPLNLVPADVGGGGGQQQGPRRDKKNRRNRDNRNNRRDNQGNQRGRQGDQGGDQN